MTMLDKIDGLPQRQNSKKDRWTRERIARLGFLVGRGWNAKRISADPIVATTTNNVHRQVARFGLAFRDALDLGIRLTPSAEQIYDDAATKRSMTRDGIIKLILLTIAREPNLIDNILDDGDGA